MVPSLKNKQARPPKKLNYKQNTHHDSLFDDEDGYQQDNHNQEHHHLPPPRKDKQKDHKQQKNKKKRAFDDALGSSSQRESASAASSSSRKAGNAATGAAKSDGTAEHDEDEEEPDNQGNAAESDDQADDEIDGRKKPLAKKLKKDAASSVSMSAAPSAGANRLVLRLPKRSKGFGPSTATLTPPLKASKNTSPSRNAVRHPGSLVPTLTSPQSSSETSERNIKLAAGAQIPSLSLDSQIMAGFGYATDSSDGYSDLLEDDEDDLLEVEEAYLIADKLHRQGRLSRRGTTSPGAKRDSDHAQSDSEGLAVHHGMQLPTSGNAREPALFGLSPRKEGATGSEYDVESALDFPVTWSGAEDDEMPDDLDEFLGITTEDSVALLGISANGDETDELDDGQTMRFEDFLGEDDGDDSSDHDSTEEESSSEDEHSVAATGTDALDRDEDEFLETTDDVVKKGGFVFFKDREQMFDNDETESEAGVSPEQEDDGGDTTDTLDDTDHLGMIRFGIEAADEDDEDAEEMLANAIRDRNLIDAHNMGLSVSIDALAEQPEAVVRRTARQLGISTEMAAKILTSVGMSILVNSGSSRDFFDGRHTASDGESSTAALTAAAAPSPNVAPDNTFKEPHNPTAHAVAKRSVQDPKPVQKTFEPVLGDFSPSREADLCVVVGQSEAPAPSPFSARKRRTRASTRLAPSPHGRGQSVTSSISSQSVASGQHAYRSTSSEEPHYNFILELDDLVDPRMLPGAMSSVSEEDEDLDDTASVSTGFGVSLHPGPVGTPSVGDVSRWNRIPIGAFRSQNPDAFASIASAVFSGSRDPAAARDLSFHGGVNVTSSKGKSRGKRYIPVSPVLFPVGQSLRSIAAGPTSSKSRKLRTKEKKSNKTKSSKSKSKISRTHSDSPADVSQNTSALHSATAGSSHSLLQPPLNQTSLPSDGLTHHVSPLFSGVANSIAIPPLSL